MDIKKIILEEINDFEWAEDVGYYVSIYDIQAGQSYLYEANYDAYFEDNLSDASVPKNVPSWLSHYDGEVIEITGIEKADHVPAYDDSRNFDTIHYVMLGHRTYGNRGMNLFRWAKLKTI